jgi:hypothetical protein
MGSWTAIQVLNKSLEYAKHPKHVNIISVYNADSLIISWGAYIFKSIALSHFQFDVGPEEERAQLLLQNECMGTDEANYCHEKIWW